MLGDIILDLKNEKRRKEKQRGGIKTLMETTKYHRCKYK